MLCQPYFAFSSYFIWNEPGLNAILVHEFQQSFIADESGRYSKEISIVIDIQGVAKRFPFHECCPVFFLMPGPTGFLPCR